MISAQPTASAPFLHTWRLVVDEFDLKTNSDDSWPGYSSVTYPPNGDKPAKYSGFNDGIKDYFDVENCDPNSFLAGQFIIDMMAGMIEGDVKISNLWSWQENSAHALIHEEGSNYYRKPRYWHYWMMANYFKGDLVARHTLTSEQEELKIGHDLPNGLYTYSIIINGQPQHSDKLVIIR